MDPRDIVLSLLREMKVKRKSIHIFYEALTHTFFLLILHFKLVFSLRKLHAVDFYIVFCVDALIIIRLQQQISDGRLSNSGVIHY